MFHRNVVSDAGLSRMADVRSRSVRIRNLPAVTQEGLLQQTLEKVTPLKRVEVFVEICEAVVELENAAVCLCHYCHEGILIILSLIGSGQALATNRTHSVRW
jgi:hypothetical protein